MSLKHIHYAAILFGLSSPAALAQEANIQITIRNHRFEPAETHAPAGRPVTLVVTNADATPEEFESKSLRVERVIPGGASSIFKLRALQPGRYRFFGEFNEATAVGNLIVE